MIEELIVCDEARIPVIWFVTYEETRAEAAIAQYVRRTNGEAWVWSLTSNNGFPGWEPPPGYSRDIESPFNEDESGTPEGAIRSVINYAHALEEKTEENKRDNSKIIAIIRDPHNFLREDIAFIRMLRDASRELRDTEGLIVCISPEDKLPIDLKTDITIIHPGLPKKETIQKVLEGQLEIYKREYKDINSLAEACVGLTLNQASDALCKSLTQFDKVDITFINKIKTETISSVPGLTYIGETPSMDKVGGLDGLKTWLEERRAGFSDKAKEAGLPIPKGALFIGVSGCGKSLLAKATASYFGMPLVCLNLPDLKGGIVGETESNLRLVKESIDSLGNCVVWIDEFEKGLPKMGERNVDGGTSDALLQGVLNWMQERKGGAFIVATANDISALPPELLRKGRWDSIFFVDLPTFEERIEIFKIHLKMRNWTLTEADIETLAERTKYYSGAEIEAACIDGRWKAFSKGRNLTKEDIVECLQADVPLYETMKEQIKSLREWAKFRARAASTNQSIQNKSRRSSSGERKIKIENMEKTNE